MTLFAAAEETAPVTGYDFDLRFQLNREGLSSVRDKRLLGYADLLDALSFHGSFFYDRDSRAVDFSLDILPDDPDAEPLRLRFFGYPETLMLTASFLGTETVLFSNISLLEFVNKTREHLGLNLQYAALLYPYVYEYALQTVIHRWNRTFRKKSESRMITAKSVKTFAATLERACTEQKETETLINSLCLTGDYAETIRAEISGLSAWLLNDITRGKGVKIRLSSGSEIWSAGNKAFFTRKFSDTDETIATNLPPTPGGYQPAFSFSNHRQEEKADLDLYIGWTRNGEDDLLSFRFTGSELPQSWPADASAEGEISLLGALYPNFAFGFGLLSDASGQFRLQLKKPSGSENAGEVFFIAEGTLIPRESPIRKYTEEEMASCVDILRVNDVTLAEFTNRIKGTAVKELVRFLVGVPASSCQSVLDDLTDTGILNMLLSE